MTRCHVKICVNRYLFLFQCKPIHRLDQGFNLKAAMIHHTMCVKVLGMQPFAVRDPGNTPGAVGRKSHGSNNIKMSLQGEAHDVQG